MEFGDPGHILVTTVGLQKLEFHFIPLILIRKKILGGLTSRERLEGKMRKFCGLDIKGTREYTDHRTQGDSLD